MAHHPPCIEPAEQEGQGGSRAEEMRQVGVRVRGAGQAHLEHQLLRKKRKRKERNVKEERTKRKMAIAPALAPAYRVCACACEHIPCVTVCMTVRNMVVAHHEPQRI